MKKWWCCIMLFFRRLLIFLWKCIKELLFPSTCLVCGKQKQDSLCAHCYQELNKEAVFELKNVTDDRFYFDYHIYAFYYQGRIKKLLTAFKFQEKSYLYSIFAKILVKNKKICGFLEKYDIIIPVPIHQKRKAQRGYNQSELICKELVKRVKEKTQIQIETDCLIKIKHTKPQSSLNKQERMENVKDVYKLQNKEKIKDKKIILLDDIYTTGSTVNACAKLLKENGAECVLIVTIAKD